jgi:putative NADH-flavin reductase
VIGGTSGIGLQTVELALQRGHKVTAIARRPERMVITHANLNTMAGDVLKADTLPAAIKNQDAVVIAIGTGPTRSPVTVFSQGGANVLQVMEVLNVRRLVAVTGIGAGETRGHGGFFYDRILLPLLLNTIYEDKNRQEALIKAQGESGAIDWTIVRPGMLTDEPATHEYRIVNDLTDYTVGSISRGDVGHFIIAAIESNTFLGQTPLISE